MTRIGRKRNASAHRQIFVISACFGDTKNAQNRQKEKNHRAQNIFYRFCLFREYVLSSKSVEFYSPCFGDTKKCSKSSEREKSPRTKNFFSILLVSGIRFILEIGRILFSLFWGYKKVLKIVRKRKIFAHRKTLFVSACFGDTCYPQNR